MTIFVDRVEDNTVLVGNDSVLTDDYLITVWKGSTGRWVLTRQGADVDSRRSRDAAVEAALRLLGVDPSDPAIERTDERW